MSSDQQIIRNLLARHYAEAENGIVDQSPSKLARGEGTERNYFILKIDLVGSTTLLMRRRKSTYLKFAHTFLSTIDNITRGLGADGDQVEYAGDSVIAYFPENSTDPMDVLAAACYCRFAVAEMQKLDRTLGELRFKCKIVLHYAPLIVARIGPRAGSALLAIGFPLHEVAKLEKETPPDTARVTMAFCKKVDLANKKYLQPLFSPNPSPSQMEIIAAARVAAPPVAMEKPAVQPRSLAGLLQATATWHPEAGYPQPAFNAQEALNALAFGNRRAPATQPQPIPLSPLKTVGAPPEQIGATLKWNLLYA
ncbi:MAG TPA: hypothetical protein VIE65_20585, partial [Methylobacter sp.]